MNRREVVYLVHYRDPLSEEPDRWWLYGRHEGIKEAAATAEEIRAMEWEPQIVRRTTTYRVVDTHGQH